jgi:hypothetical protein
MTIYGPWLGGRGPRAQPGGGVATGGMALPISTSCADVAPAAQPGGVVDHMP